MSIDRAQQGSHSYCHYRKHALLGSVAALGLGLGFGLAVTLAFSSPAAARYGSAPDMGSAPNHHDRQHGKGTEHVSKEPFGNISKGPLQIFISINQEKLHLYSDGTQIAEAPVATGMPGHPTPMGVFSIIQKDRYHHSNIYSGAPMPYMQRITWSGVAMHVGVDVGHPASHGCIRLPQSFAARLWVLTKLGVRVIIARNELKPVPFEDAHLFVHKDQSPIAALAYPIKTAQSVDDSKKTDAIDPAVPAAEANETIVPKTIAGDAPAPLAQQPTDAAKPAGAPTAETVRLHDTATDVAAPIATPDELVPMPPPKPAKLAEAAEASHAPISIFVSRKEKKIFVRQHFAPLFAAPITIAHPEQPLGTHVFTAMAYLDDNSKFRWNVVSLGGEPPRAVRKADSDDTDYGQRGKSRHREERAETSMGGSLPQSAEEALARLDIPQDVIDQIQALMVPGSSLVVSDQGLGPETGEGTDFIIVTR